MTQKYQFTTIDRLLAKFHRDMKNNDIDEADIIEWAGEALAHAMTPGAYEEVIRFSEVNNYEVDMPSGLTQIIQIAKNTKYNEDPRNCTPEDTVADISEEIIESDNSDCGPCSEGWLDNAIPVDPEGNIIGDYEVAYYRPFFDYYSAGVGQIGGLNYFQDNYIPVELADNSFFKSIVQRPDQAEHLLNTSAHNPEYTPVQDKIRFSFEKGFVAIAYHKIPTDCRTGYPKIPDDQSLLDLLSYYVTFKIKEGECFNHRKGACQLAEIADHKFQSSLREFIAKTKMPSTIDEKENLKRLDNTMILNRNMTSNFFGNLNKREIRRYNMQGKTRNY